MIGSGDPCGNREISSPSIGPSPIIAAAGMIDYLNCVRLRPSNDDVGRGRKHPIDDLRIWSSPIIFSAMRASSTRLVMSAFDIPAIPIDIFCRGHAAPNWISEASDILELDLDSNCRPDLRRASALCRAFHSWSRGTRRGRTVSGRAPQPRLRFCVPFTVTDTGFKPIWRSSASIGPGGPDLGDLRLDFPEPTNNMLIVNDEIAARQ